MARPWLVPLAGCWAWSSCMVEGMLLWGVSGLLFQCLGYKKVFTLMLAYHALLLLVLISDVGIHDTGGRLDAMGDYICENWVDGDPNDLFSYSMYKFSADMSQDNPAWQALTANAAYCVTAAFTFLSAEKMCFFTWLDEVKEDYKNAEEPYKNLVRFVDILDLVLCIFGFLEVLFDENPISKLCGALVAMLLDEIVDWVILEKGCVKTREAELVDEPVFIRISESP